MHKHLIQLGNIVMIDNCTTRYTIKEFRFIDCYHVFLVLEDENKSRVFLTRHKYFIKSPFIPKKIFNY